MKKIILGAALLCSILSFGQLSKLEIEKPIKVTKIAPLGSFVIENEQYSDHVRIRFKNTQFQHITDIKSFDITKEDYESLSKLLLTSDNKEDDTYNIPTSEDGKLYIKYKKSLGVIFPTMYWFNKVGTLHSIQYLTSSQLKKLFEI